MKNITTVFSIIATLVVQATFAQTKVVTTGNNPIDPTNPYSADIVIGSDQGGIRHDASMMWWSNESACRISLSGNSFLLSGWLYPASNANVSLGALPGQTSYFMGNVSIGTNDSKGYKFAVNGSAVATSMTIKLSANWPDYVFKPTYQLPSLAEVKSYIDQNQHLPEIPSAEEVEKNGQNLGEMNKLLMKKVEELTLYAIENERQDKERETTKDKLLASLQEQINLLKEQLTAIQKGYKN
ncbi:hypothetical protein [Mucilaginibacter sp. 3215]|uniref:hypothetical protein n=1 Tax=Mucilaginibacter sp. 3215 TaxID=3373912 RepID=UPI003D1FD6DA